MKRIFKATLWMMMVAAAICFGACNDESSGGTPDIDPAAVSGLTATTAVDHVTLVWTDPSNAMFDHIEITWTPDGIVPVSIDPGTQTCEITMPADGTAHTFTVTSVFDVDTSLDAAIDTTGEAEIYSAADLDNIRNDLAAHYVITADIDLTGYAWAPIGTDAARFTGNLNGNGYIIGNLTVSGASNYQGLFGCIGADGGVTSLRLENVSVSGITYVGALAGSNYGGIGACSASGVVNGTENHVGGLVGVNYGTVSNSHAACAVSGIQCIGGLAGGLGTTGLISYCYAAGSVEGAICVGGLVGGNSGPIQNSYATGHVEGTNEWAGGLVGRNYAGSVTNCYATGSVIGNIHVGGLAGMNYSGRTISNSYSTGLVDGNQNVGGLIGENTGTVNNSYYYRAPDNSIGTSLTEAQMKDSVSFSGWDFASLWRIATEVNNGFPYLVTRPNAVNGLAAVTTATSVTLAWADPEAGGFDHIEVTWDGSTVYTISAGTETYTATVNADGTVRTFTVRTVYANGTIHDAAVCTTGVVEIATAAELDNVRNSLAAHYILMADIDLSAYSSGEGWSPIGTDFWTSFNGSLNGNGHVISNLTINRPSGDSQGLFGFIGSEGIIFSLGITGGTVTGMTGIGLLSGYNIGTLTDCYAAGNVSGGADSFYLGGLIGCNDTGTVSNCYVTGSVSGGADSFYLGGLIGCNNTGTVNNCYATVAVTGGANSYSLGGLVGDNYEGSVNNCYYYQLPDNSFGTHTTSDNMKLQGTYTGWDFAGETANGTEDIWSIDMSGSVNSGYPYLTNNH